MAVGVLQGFQGTRKHGLKIILGTMEQKENKAGNTGTKAVFGEQGTPKSKKAFREVLMTRPSSPDMPPKCNKMVRLGINIDIYILFYSSAKDDYNIDKESYHSLTISSDGSVSRFFPTIYKSSCKLDVTNFPFDDQVTILIEHALATAVQ